jgi:hypothetical protein
MKTNEENPVTCMQARIALGAPGKPMSKMFMSALRKEMGVTGRWMFLSQIRKFLRENPNFKIANAYPPGPKKKLDAALA